MGSNVHLNPGNTLRKIEDYDPKIQSLSSKKIEDYDRFRSPRLKIEDYENERSPRFFSRTTIEFWDRSPRFFLKYSLKTGCQQFLVKHPH